MLIMALAVHITDGRSLNYEARGLLLSKMKKLMVLANLRTGLDHRTVKILICGLDWISGPE